MDEVDSVLLIAFGGPERHDDIRPFLQRVTEGRRIPPERLEEVARHYERIGGRSPLGDLTRRQAAGLRAALSRRCDARPVFVGMRNWHPFLHETLAEMQAQGHRCALGIILSSFQTEASWDRYVADVAGARARVGAGAPDVRFAPGWAAHPLFLDAMTDRCAAALAKVPIERQGAAHLIFTAHSVPVAMAGRSPYVAQLESASRHIAERLGHARWSVAYQSRSGPPSDPWLDPEIGDALRACVSDGVRDAVVAPIGFACDHVEVLYDLDVEARQLAQTLGLGYHRAAAANDHPRFIEMLADLVRVGPARS